MTKRLPFTLLLGVLSSLLSLSAMGRSEGSIQKTWDYPPEVTTLVIDADRQDVVVKEGGPRITGRLVGESGDEVKAIRDGSTVTLTVRGGRGWFSWGKRSARIELSVPQGMALDITTASGAILVRAPTESFRARSASGDIEAARGGHTADVDSTSGTVRLKGFVESVKAATFSGDLLLEDLAGSLQAATLSGRLEGRGLKPSDHSRFTTVSGEADLTLDGGSDAYAVQTESVSGRLSVGESRGEGKLAAGSGPTVIIKSVSGDVRVQ